MENTEGLTGKDFCGVMFVSFGCETNNPDRIWEVTLPNVPKPPVTPPSLPEVREIAPSCFHNSYNQKESLREIHLLSFFSWSSLEPQWWKCSTSQIHITILTTCREATQCVKKVTTAAEPKVVGGCEWWWYDKGHSTGGESSNNSICSYILVLVAVVEVVVYSVPVTLTNKSLPFFFFKCTLLTNQHVSLLFISLFVCYRTERVDNGKVTEREI